MSHLENRDGIFFGAKEPKKRKKKNHLGFRYRKSEMSKKKSETEMAEIEMAISKTDIYHLDLRDQWINMSESRSGSSQLDA